MHKSAILNASNLRYELANTERLFQDISIAIHESDRIGLVGGNGSGKSTLLKLLAGQLTLQTGMIKNRGGIYYLPQINTLNSSVLNTSILDWINAFSDEWWQITTLLEDKFTTELDLSQSIASLSGGELTKLWLATAFWKQPDILLLDEPTNHLDLVALEQLRTTLQAFNGAFVIVSHKPRFLNQVVDTIWEITSSELKVYGGNYSFYQSQKQTEYQAALRDHEVARKELQRAKISALQEQQRAAKSRQQGNKCADSLPTVVAGARKRKAENTAGIAKQKHQAAVEKATEKVTETKIKPQKQLVLN